MNSMLNCAYLEKLVFDIHQPRLIKKIKVTSQFYAYLAAHSTDYVVHTKYDDSPRGYVSTYFGIPIEIDNTIYSDYYELVY